MERKYVSIDEATEICGVGRRTIYNWINLGKIKVVRTPGGSARIDRTQLLTDRPNPNRWQANDNKKNAAKKAVI